MFDRSCRAGLAASVVLSSLSMSSLASAQWVVGSTQFAPANTSFTYLFTSFTVPPAPSDGTTTTVSAVWTGLSGATEQQTDSTVLQPVLGYNFTGNDGQVDGWSMHSEVQPGSIYGKTVSVQTGDTIVGVVYLNTYSPGSNCNETEGNGRPLGMGCNYVVYWIDYTTGVADEIQFTLPSNVFLYYAQGLVFEQPTGDHLASSCADFPGNYTTASTELDVWGLGNPNTSAGSPYSSVTMNLVADQPGNAGFANPNRAGGGTLSCPISAIAQGGTTDILFASLF